MPAEGLSSLYTLSLFPLNFVLFPEFTVQIHVFEERYKAMISNCIERHTSFGVVLIQEGEEVGAPAKPHVVGCTARILAVKREEDGRMHLLVVGGERFRLLEAHVADLPYLVGRVELLEDIPEGTGCLTSYVEETARIFRRYLQLLEETAQFELPDLDLPSDPTLLAFTIVAVSQLTSHEKQRLLAMTDARSRLEEVSLYLRNQITELESLRSGQLSEPSAEADEPRVVIAEPLDTANADWKRYRHEARN